MRNLAKATACCTAAILLAGCTASHYRKSADKEVYNIIQEKQQSALGQTNAFSINTPYSDRNPKDIKAQEIVEDRTREAKVTVSLPEALRIALEKNRPYQLRKESLYLSALTLTRERFAYVPQFFTTTDDRVNGNVRLRDGNFTGGALTDRTRAGVATAFKTGGRISLDLANDLLAFYSGGRGDHAVTTVGLSLSQPLLRGAGAKIAAENLTQAERNVIYEIRSFSYYQDTFAFDIVQTYFRLVQQQDAVKNNYNNFQSRVALRERSVALSFDRLAPIQADQARQEELAARNAYILSVERYRSSLDQFKITLGLPAGYDIRLDENSLTDLEKVGLLPAPFGDEQSFRIALEKRPDLLNEIDAFEDSKRKIDVAKDQLRPGLLAVGDASMPIDYQKFNETSMQWSAGLKLDLPLNRELERNIYRTTIINFEKQLRTLAAFLDDLKTDLRSDLRTLDQSRQSYEIQNSAKALADRRVESSELSLQAGRVQVRDVVEAQNARIQAYNAATAALIDYHLTRMRLLLDLGLLRTSKEKFWLDAGELPTTQTPAPAVAPTQEAANRLITPDELFQNDKGK